MKKTWEKPKLIVLTRNAPEESLIIWCKGNGSATMPSSSFTACYQLDITCIPCVMYGTS